MSQLVPTPPSFRLTRDVRRSSRVIGRSASIRQIRFATINDEADVAMEKVEVLTDATGLAMGAVSKVALAQRQLDTLTPEASGRLAYLADSHLLAVGDTVQDLRRELRRH